VANIPEALKHLKVVQGRLTRISGQATRLYAVLEDGTVYINSETKPTGK
jgi:hypothetical protein